VVLFDPEVGTADYMQDVQRGIRLPNGAPRLASQCKCAGCHGEHQERERQRGPDRGDHRRPQRPRVAAPPVSFEPLSLRQHCRFCAHPERTHVRQAHP
jgi:hypothetical protein